MPKDINQIEIEIPKTGKLPFVRKKKSKNNSADSDGMDKITHDIRSAINIIIGYAQLMLDETTGKINARQRKALQDILNSSHKLNDLTDAVINQLDEAPDKK